MNNFFRFLACTLGLALMLTLIASTLIYAEGATRPALAEEAATAEPAAPAPPPAPLKIEGDTTRTTLIPTTGTKYTVGGKELEFNLKDPKLSDVPFLILWIIEFFVGLSGIVAVFYLIYGGFQYFYELRHPGGEASTAKQTIYHAILGLVIVMMSYIFIAAIVGGITGY